MPYDRLQLVAVRFDLCDRDLPGPCPEAEDARMRLVFQPLSGAPARADDIGFHAFYTVARQPRAQRFKWFYFEENTPGSGPVN